LPLPLEHIPITDVQWQTVKSMVEQLPLEKARTNIWEKQKLDDSEFREPVPCFDHKAENNSIS